MPQRAESMQVFKYKLSRISALRVVMVVRVRSSAGKILFYYHYY